MLTNIGKRSISFLMALVMIFSMVPVQAFATEDTGDQNHDHVEETTAPAAAVIHEHVYTESTVDANCTTGGYVNHVCECGDSYITDETDALGHSYETQVIAPTAEAEGYTLHTCSACGDNYKDSYVEKLPAQEDTHTHSYEAVKTEPTCGAAGFTTYTCSCGDSYVADEVAATGAHSYEAVKTEPTCGAAGFTTYTCSCGDSYVADEVAATGLHDYEETVVAPTTEAEGYTLHTCTVCGHSYQDNIREKLPAETEPAEETLLEQLRGEIAEYIETYGLTHDMPDSVLADVYFKLDGPQSYDAWAIVQDIEARAMELSVAEADSLIAEQNSKLVLRFYDVMREARNPVMMDTASEELSIADGIVMEVSGGSTTSDAANGVYTVTAKGKTETKSGSCGSTTTTHSSTTATIYIRNTQETPRKVSFAWTATIGEGEDDSVGSINPVPPQQSGTDRKEILIQGKKEYTIVLTSPKGEGKTTSVIISAIESVDVAGFYDVTVLYDDSLGAVTRTDEVDGTVSVDNGELLEVPTTGGTTFTAAANSGAKFLGWINDAEHTIFTTETSFTMVPTGAMDLRAVFISESETTPWFALGTLSTPAKGNEATFSKVSNLTHLYAGLNEASAVAASCDSKVMVLLNDATLTTGDHTIPAGVTMLVPFDDAYSLFTTEADCHEDGTYKQPTAFRTLTLESGANLNVLGGLSLSGKHYYASGGLVHGGAPGGPTAFVQMNANSAITVGSGGTLYAYGYVTGSHDAKVEIQSGGTVYELFQVGDYRGGGGTTNIAVTNKRYKIFPITQYYVQNVEIPMYLYAGATEHSYATIYATGTHASSVPFIGTSGMFNLTSGYAVKYYDGARDRMVVEAYGDMAINTLSVDMAGTNVNTRDFMLPIHGGVTVNVVSGNFSINQNIALYPGAEVIIGEDARCTMGQDKIAIVYDGSTWGGYVSSTNVKFVPLKWSPSRQYTRTESDLVDASVVVKGQFDSSNGYLYSTVKSDGTDGGANITGVEGALVKVKPGTQTITYQGTQKANSGIITTYTIVPTEIPIENVWLKNSDSSFTKTGKTVGSFLYEDGTWRLVCTATEAKDHIGVTVKDPTCTEDGSITGTCPDHGEINAVLPATGHSWNEAVVTWADDGSACTAVRTCKNDTAHQENATAAEITSDVTTTPNCTTPKVTTYTAKFNEEWAQAKVTTKEVTGDVEKDDHAWDDATATVTWAEDGSTCTAVRACANNADHKQEVQAVEIKAEVTTEPTCAIKKVTTYTAKFNEDWAQAKATTKEVVGEVNAEGHAWGGVVYTWNDSLKKCTASRTCGNAGCPVGTESANVTMTEEQKTPPTCVQKEITTWTATFDKDWAETQTKDYVGSLATDNHSWGTEINYEWSADGKTCKATRVCTNVGDNDGIITACDHSETATAQVGIEVKTPATCASGVVTTNTATFTAEWAQPQVKEFTGAKDPNAHTWSSEFTYVWNDTTRTCTAERKCTNPECSAVDSLNPVGEIARGIITQADCVNEEAVKYTATFEGWAEGTDSKIYYNGKDVNNHDWTEVTFTWSDDHTSCTAKQTCQRDGCEASNEATASNPQKTVTAATCSAKEATTYTIWFGQDWIPAEDRQQTDTVYGDINPEAHDWNEVEYTWDAESRTYSAKRTCKYDPEHVEYATFKEVKTQDNVIANCVTEGKVTYTTYFEETWASAKGQQVNIGTNSDHWMGDPTYEWIEEGTKCVATRMCQRDGCNHSETMNGVMTDAVTTPPTCMTKKVTTYTATFTGWAEAVKTNEVTGETDDTVHNMGDAQYSWNAEEHICAATRNCTYGCGKTETASVTMRDERKSAATCMQAEVRTFTAEFAEDWAETQSQDYSVGEPNENAHAWGESTVTWANDGSSCTAIRVCEHNGQHKQTATAVISSSATIPTCVDAKVTTYIASFTEEWAVAEDKIITGDVDPSGHKWGETSYSWDEAAKICTASHTCEYEDCPVGTEEATAVMSSERKTAGTCVKPEVRTFTAEFDVGWAETQVKDLDCEKDINAHDWEETSYTWNSVTEPCTAVRVCKNDPEHTETAKATITHDVTTEADCITNEIVTYYAKFDVSWAAQQTKDVIGDKNENKHHNLIIDSVDDATCTEPGTQAGSHCDSCGFKEGAGEIKPYGHNWDKTIVYTWSEDFTTCTATRICLRDAKHNVTLNATVTTKVTEATCSAAEVTTYSVSFEAAEVDWAVTQVEQKETGPKIADAHDWGEAIVTWANDGSSCTAVRVCKHDGQHKQTATAKVSSSATIPTCVDAKVTTCTAIFEEEWAVAEDKIITGDVDPNGHDWSETSYSWNAENKSCTASRTCENGCTTGTQTATAAMSSVDKTPATCVKPEVRTFTATFNEDWAETQIKDLECEVDINAHDWGEPMVEWAEDGSACTAVRTCKHSAEHIEEDTANVSSNFVAATCVQPAKTTYTATFPKGWANAEPLVITGEVDANAHSWNDPVYDWNAETKIFSAKRTCQYDNRHEEPATVTMSHKTTVEATCSSTGIITYTADFAEEWAENQTQDVTVPVNPENHKWGTAEYSAWSEDGTSISAKRVCSYDKNHTEQAKVTITPEVTTEATCKIKGVTTYTAVFNEEWANRTLVNAVTGDYNKDNHKNIVTDQSVEPTCTEEGKTEGSHCGDCGTTLVEQQSVPAKNHIWGTTEYSWSADGKTCSAKRVCQNDASHVETANATMDFEVTTVATCTTPQVITYTATFDVEWAETQTNDVSGRVDATNHNWGAPSYKWSTDGKTCTAERVCQNDAKHVETATATITSQVTREATCSVAEVVTYTAMFAKAWAETQTNPVTGEMDEEAHNWGETKYIWSTDGKACNAERSCTYNADHKETAEATVTSRVTTEANCSVAQVVTYTAKFAVNWAETQTNPVIGEKYNDAHSWNAATVTWAEDGSVCTAIRTCKHDSEHKQEAVATVTSEVITEATCTTKKVTTYSAVFDVEWAEAKPKVITGDIDETVHNWGETQYTWSEDDKTCTAERVCTENADHKETADAVVSSQVTTEANCTVAEVVTYTAVFNVEWAEKQVKPVTGTVNADAHNWGEVDYIWSEDGSSCIAKRVCTNSEKHIETADAAITSEESVEATCKIQGETIYTAVYDEPWVQSQTKTVIGETAPDNHKNLVTDEAKAPTCMATGLTEGGHCDDCGETVVAQETVDMIAHDLAEATCQAPASCKNEGCTYTEGEPLEHVPVQDDEEPAMCGVPGKTAGSHCEVCNETLSGREEIPALEHKMVSYEAKRPTYTGVGWEAYEACTLCGISTKKEIPKLDEPVIADYDTFMTNLVLLEEAADTYVQQNPGKDPAGLVIKFIRTGVERYNSGSWGIMAGYEDAAFAEFVYTMEDQYNSAVADESQMLMISGLKNLKNFNLPNGDVADLGHVFGMMDITYHNNFSLNHADVAGWAGDTVDLLSLSDQFGVSGSLDEMVADISENYLLKSESTFPEKPKEGSFSLTDMQGDMDGFYIMRQLGAQDYEKGTITAILRSYFTADLNDVARADYFLKNRLGGVSLRNDIRNAVYNAYTGNSVVTTLEATREFDSSDLATMKKACCYAVADYLCRLAGDFVDVTENSYFTVFSTETSTLAPGITQEIKMATSADNKQMVYYIATADITRDDVNVYANYNNNDPGAGWAMQRVMDQANAAQNKYGNPESEHYIPNYNVVVSTNGAGFAMTTDGEPGGLLVMGGVEYHPIDGNGFFGILKDGTAVIGTTQEYNTIYKDQVQEGIAGFGSTLVKDGKISVSASSSYYNNRASRTAVGITKTGKVVLMVLDGRQEPWSCGGSMEEIAQIMLEAGCRDAINLDGGGSTTFIAKPEGADSLELVNRPSDGFQRSVGATLMMVSTAPSSTAFDHAILDSDTDYMTIGANQQIIAEGVSATGNAAEIPEGAVWSVSNDRWGSITEDGVFTALRNGDVDINLMLGEQVLGTKTMHVVVPNNLYFTKSKLDVVYGETVDLPIKMLYNGKNVTGLPSDMKFNLDAEGAGTFDGFTFTASETSTIRAAKITAALAGNESITASISVALYNQGEASFNFEKATGGDRQLAWDRKVSNSTTEDAITYNIVDTDEDMVTSYIFAIDMTQIPIPKQLGDLVHMLPGADVEGASAWGFLCQLAQRVSVLTEVRPTLQFDPNFEVDASGLTLVNEYFELQSKDLDEETNTLTLYLKWKKQTQAIDPNEANPMCILSGIKLTPKQDADWGAKESLTAVHSGKVGYDIYLRASSLYSFAQKPENQETYGLTPYVNPADSSDAGAGFGDIYKEFQDTYTLVRVLKNGWINEEGGFAYYVNNVKHTGIHEVDGYYYDFGENGINVGQTKYTGLLTVSDNLCYARLGKLVSGWYAIDSDYYYFDPVTFAAHTGESTIDQMAYTFDEEGTLIRGVFVKEDGGTRYYWAGQRKYREWIDLDEGRRYVDDDGYVAFGNWLVKQNATEATTWWEFDEETGIVIGLSDGFVTHKGKEYYCENGKWFYGAVAVEDGIIFSGSNGLVTKNSKCYIAQDLETIAGLADGLYWCGADGRIVGNGFATIDGDDYYFADYVRAKGFTKVGDDYYYFNASSGKMYKNVTLWVAGNNPYNIPGGYNEFQEDGRMYVADPNGFSAIIEENGNLYFTIDGVKQKKGLYELDGEYYYAKNDCVLAVDETVWVSEDHGLLTENYGYYAFGSDAKMIKTGFVTGGGATYYYKDLVRLKGFIQIGFNYYFLNAGSGKMYRDATLWVGANNYGIANGMYYFRADGTMLDPAHEVDGKKVVKVDDSWYFLIDGVAMKSGLYELMGEYYYAFDDGTLAAGSTIWIQEKYDQLPSGSGFYGFTEDAKLVKNGFIESEDGTNYYYSDAVRAKGLTKIGDDYYFFNAGSGKMYKGVTLWVSSNNYGLEGGYYDFQEDGRMYVPAFDITTGIVEKNGNLYYVVDGIMQINGLVEVDGEYYYAQPSGVLARNQTIWMSQKNGLIPAKGDYYAFDSDGKLIKTGFVTGGGYTYYYDNLNMALGFTKIGTDYYIFNAGSGKMYKDVTMWVGANNYGFASGFYYFYSDGKMDNPNPDPDPTPDPEPDDTIKVTGIVEENGKLYYLIDNVKQTNGMVEVDGEYYYAQSGGVLARNQTIWVSKKNGLIPARGDYYAFDSDGKLIKTGFVNGGEYTYYYDNLNMALGFTKIEDAYYFFNASSGKMYRDVSLWVGNNAYGIEGGFHYFRPDGTMEQG